MQMFGRTVIYTDVTSVTAENVRDVLYRFLQQIPAVFGGDFAWRNRVCPSRIKMYQSRFLLRGLRGIAFDRRSKKNALAYCKRYGCS